MSCGRPWPICAGGKYAEHAYRRPGPKLYNLLSFVCVAMQSPNGYFYNFLLTGSTINMIGPTSVNDPDWWSWRALQALTEAGPVIKSGNPTLFALTDAAVHKLVAQLKTDFAYLPETTSVASGIVVPTWLPAGSGTDQSSVLLQGLINYCKANNDTAIVSFIRKLADGIVSMQQGDANDFPYDAFLSWSNTWHAYGNVQAYALMQAGIFLQDTVYTDRAMTEVDNFYPWLLQNGLLESLLRSTAAGAPFKPFARPAMTRSLMGSSRWSLPRRGLMPRPVRRNMRISPVILPPGYWGRMPGAS